MNDKKTYITISEVAKQLGLINKKNGKLQTHTIRYWETQFKQLKPKIMAGKRRYYSSKDLMIIERIKFLLKEKGLTISGVKKLLNDSNLDSIDEGLNFGVYKSVSNNTNLIKDRIKNISKIIKEIKKIKNG
jgi:DNA-binding transcriptional MerR regulator